MARSEWVRLAVMLPVLIHHTSLHQVDAQRQGAPPAGRVIKVCCPLSLSRNVNSLRAVNARRHGLQDMLGIPQGAIKATVLIETLPAAFEMDEILYELRRHSAGLNCGRWDYIFSFIKTTRADPASVMPDRWGLGPAFAVDAAKPALSLTLE